MDFNIINNMKVADLRKELKAKGISTIGNKSELTARLLASLKSDKTHGDNDSELNEDDDVLGSDILEGSEGDGKGDDSVGDALIDDVLLGTAETTPRSSTTNTAPTKLTRVTAASLMINTKPVITKTVSPIKESDGKEIAKASSPIKTDDKSDDSDSKKASKSDVKSLTITQRMEMRALKFGDNKLSERAKRFGESPSAETITGPASQKGDDTDKLKKRAERFGAVVSDKMKKIDEHERLMKRKERFGAVTASTVSSNTKQTITFSPDTDDRKRRRLERFGVS